MNAIELFLMPLRMNGDLNLVAVFVWLLVIALIITGVLERRADKHTSNYNQLDEKRRDYGN